MLLMPKQQDLKQENNNMQALYKSSYFEIVRAFIFLIYRKLEAIGMLSRKRQAM